MSLTADEAAQLGGLMESLIPPRPTGGWAELRILADWLMENADRLTGELARLASQLTLRVLALERRPGLLAESADCSAATAGRYFGGALVREGEGVRVFLLQDRLVLPLYDELVNLGVCQEIYGRGRFQGPGGKSARLTVYEDAVDDGDGCRPVAPLSLRGKRGHVMEGGDG